MKKVLFSVIAILLAVGLVGGGAFAVFQDVETMDVGDIQAGTLNLQVGVNDPSTVHITIGDIAPGWGREFYYDIKNVGTLSGQLWLEFSEITNRENGVIDPEDLVDSTTGELEGELGEFLALRFRRYQMDWWKDGAPLDALNTFDSTKWFTEEDKKVILAPGEVFNLEMHSYFKTGLGGDDNLAQSDSVEFDITFHLDQTDLDESKDSSTP